MTALVQHTPRCLGVVRDVAAVCACASLPATLARLYGYNGILIGLTVPKFLVKANVSDSSFNSIWSAAVVVVVFSCIAVVLTVAIGAWEEASSPCLVLDYLLCTPPAVCVYCGWLMNDGTKASVCTLHKSS
jgi:urea transporter